MSPAASNSPSAPVKVPVRILVKAASSAVFVAPSGGRVGELPYPRCLAGSLADRGVPAEVLNAATEGQLITRMMCDWEQDVQQFGPDVIILNVGEYECLPGILPFRLERHANSRHRHSARYRQLYRRRILRPFWRTVASWQVRLDARLDPGPNRLSPARTRAELRWIIERTQEISAPLFIVMQPWPITNPWTQWYPGMSKRLTVMRDEIDNLIAEINRPDVQLFPLWDLVSAHELNVVLPDGVHFSSALHAEIAEALADRIADWIAQHPHLSRSSPERAEGLGERVG